jgi:hypothetical protein
MLVGGRRAMDCRGLPAILGVPGTRGVPMPGRQCLAETGPWRSLRRCSWGRRVATVKRMTIQALLRPRPGGDHRRARGTDRLRAPAGRQPPRQRQWSSRGRIRLRNVADVTRDTELDVAAVRGEPVTYRGIKALVPERVAEIGAKRANPSTTKPPRMQGLRNDGARGTRTPDLLGAIQALSQLSYSPSALARTPKVGVV